MAYRHEDTNLWVEKLLPIQRGNKSYISVDQARQVFKLAGKSATQARLLELCKRGQAERFKIGEIWHYHIIEVKK
jgi:RNA:NAD 2'-phosphotransferase (TPT1/KptA family)